MNNIRTLDVSDVGFRRSVVEQINANPNTEVALWLWWVVRWTVVSLKNALEYKWSAKSEWQVSFDTLWIQTADQEFREKWLETVWQSHDHLEDKWHAHDWSGQDEKTIEWLKDDENMHAHVLWYKRVDWTVEWKAVDREWKDLELVANWVKWNIVKLFEDWWVEVRKAS